MRSFQAETQATFTGRKRPAQTTKHAEHLHCDGLLRFFRVNQPWRWSFDFSRSIGLGQSVTIGISECISEKRLFCVRPHLCHHAHRNYYILQPSKSVPSKRRNRLAGGITAREDVLGAQQTVCLQMQEPSIEALRDSCCSMLRVLLRVRHYKLK